MKHRPLLTLLALLAGIALVCWQFTLLVAWKDRCTYLALSLSLIMLPWSHRLVYLPGYNNRNSLLTRVPKPVQTLIFAGFLGLVLTHVLAGASCIGATPQTQNATILALETPLKTCLRWTLQLADGHIAHLCYNDQRPHAVGQRVTVQVRESLLAYHIRFIEP